MEKGKRLYSVVLRHGKKCLFHALSNDVTWTTGDGLLFYGLMLAYFLLGIFIGIIIANQ